MNSVVAATPDPVRSIVVTGVARSGQLGDTIARRFGTEGARVSIVARSLSDATARAAEMRTDGLDVHPYACDLVDTDATVELARRILADVGRIDALVNAAGGFAMSGPVADSDPALLTRQIAINLSTAYSATRAFLPALRASRGAVVFVASASALPAARIKDASAYAIAKGGVVTLMRATAQEELVRGVRANAVAPGTIRTRDNAATLPPGTRFVEPESVASLIVYLCSAHANQVTGQLIELTP